MNSLLMLAIPTLLVGIPLENVARILPLARLQAIPEAPDWFLGLLNLEGHSLPVIDLALRLGMAESPPYQLSTPIVVLTWQGRQVGLIVQEVVGIGPILDDRMSHTELFTANGPPFLGVARTSHGGLTLVLDPARMLEMPLQLTEPEWNTAQEWPQLIAALQEDDDLARPV